MNKIHLYCGEYQFIPTFKIYDYSHAPLEMPDARYSTGHKMVEVGKEIFRKAEQAVDTHSVRCLYTNDENVFNGLRLALGESDVEGTEERLEIFFYDSAGKLHSIRVNKNATINAWPIGFFDSVTDTLSDVIGLKFKAA